MRRQPTFERHARTVALLTLASRILGLGREAVFSRVFGAGKLMDAFFFAFMLPNLFRRLFGEGALAAAFLPVYTRLDRDDRETARRLATLTIGTLVALLGALVVAGEVVLLLVVLRSGEESRLVPWLMMIMLPYMPMVCVVAILGAMLHVHGRFGPPAAAPIVLNVAMIAAAAGYAWIGDDPGRELHVTAAACSVLVAGVLQVAWALAALRPWPWWRRDAFRDLAARAPFRRMLRQALPMIVGLGVLQINTFFDGVIASYPVTFGPTIAGYPYPLTEGAMAAVSFAQRLYQFPLGVFGIAVATAIFPLLARQVHDGSAFVATLQRGLRLVVFIGLPASVGLALVRTELAAAILEGGRFSADDTARTARVLLGYAPAVWAYSMTHVLTRAFYARGDAMTPVRVAIAVVALNLALNVTLIWTPLREAALAWSTAICAALQATALVILARRRVGPLVDRRVCASWARSIAVSIVMAAAVAITAALLPDAASWSGDVLRLAAMVLAGAAAVVLTSVALRMPELRWAVGTA